MFQLSPDEFANLKSQFATSSWGGRRTLPYAFTEHGAIMAASVLNSKRAVEMSVYVVRAFVQLRDLLSSQKVLTEQVTKLERRVSHHDNSLAEIIDALRSLMERPSPAKRGIGFTTKWSDDKATYVRYIFYSYLRICSKWKRPFSSAIINLRRSA
jgi:lipopolysaccharide biosynthesis glycosyltransferase